MYFTHNFSHRTRISTGAQQHQLQLLLSHVNSDFDFITNMCKAFATSLGEKKMEIVIWAR